MRALGATRPVGGLLKRHEDRRSRRRGFRRKLPDHDGAACSRIPETGERRERNDPRPGWLLALPRTGCRGVTQGSRTVWTRTPWKGGGHQKRKKKKNRVRCARLEARAVLCELHGRSRTWGFLLGRAEERWHGIRSVRSKAGWALVCILKRHRASGPRGRELKESRKRRRVARDCACAWRARASAREWERRRELQVLKVLSRSE